MFIYYIYIFVLFLLQRLPPLYHSSIHSKEIFSMVFASVFAMGSKYCTEIMYKQLTILLSTTVNVVN